MNIIFYRNNNKLINLFGVVYRYRHPPAYELFLRVLQFVYRIFSCEYNRKIDFSSLFPHFVALFFIKKYIYIWCEYVAYIFLSVPLSLSNILHCEVTYCNLFLLEAALLNEKKKNIILVLINYILRDINMMVILLLTYITRLKKCMLTFKRKYRIQMIIVFF